MAAAQNTLIMMPDGVTNLPRSSPRALPNWRRAPGLPDGPWTRSSIGRSATLFMMKFRYGSVPTSGASTRRPRTEPRLARGGSE
jgi:hypothetical protein